jgi:SAM-dependent methyltransferase
MSNSNNRSELSDVAAYYSEKISTHGDKPQGVDWNGIESQNLRFAQLCRLFDSTRPFSLNDLGCGYGAILDFLPDSPEIQYRGFDISEAMVEAARRRHADKAHAEFMLSSVPDRNADYGIASGIFNVRLEHSDREWWDIFKRTLDILNATSVNGFAFNCLTSYSDAHKMRDYLYYANPCDIFDHCKRNYSRNVALLHDYELYEFTILVRKNT